MTAPVDAFSPVMSRSPGAVPLMLVGLQEYLDARPEAAREGRASTAKDEGAVVPGPAFGPSGEGFVRACYATSLEQIKTAMKRIGDFCDQARRA